MSDPTQADQSAEAAQGAVEPAGSPPPWGDDFNAERAWQTITHLRGREKELETQAKQYERLRSDPEAQKDFLAELGYEVEDETPDDGIDPDEYDDPSQAELAQVRQELAQMQEWRQQQEYQAAKSQYDQHYSSLVEQAKEKHGVDLNDPMFSNAVLTAASNDPKGVKNETVEAAFQKLVDWALAQKPQDQTPPSVPSPPPAGRQGTVDHKPGDRKTRQERMAAALLGGQQS